MTFQKPAIIFERLPIGLERAAFRYGFDFLDFGLLVLWKTGSRDERRECQRNEETMLLHWCWYSCKFIGATA